MASTIAQKMGDLRSVCWSAPSAYVVCADMLETGHSRR